MFICGDCVLIKTYYPKRRCRVCVKREYHRIHNRRWRRKNKLILRTAKKVYGWSRKVPWFSRELGERLLANQSGLCAICGTKPIGKDLHMDHDHKSLKVRGFLCALCNMGLGHFKDNIDLLLKAVSYLKEPGYASDVTVK